LHAPRVVGFGEAGDLRRLSQIQLYRHPLTAEQAHMLLAALTSTTDPASYLEQRAVHPEAEHALKRTGLVEVDRGPHRPPQGWTGCAVQPPLPQHSPRRPLASFLRRH
jgi:hypothetical protein